MQRQDRAQRAQKISAQSATATGKAITKPRAKLGHRLRNRLLGRSPASWDVSFGLLALSIVVSDLLLFSQGRQRAVKATNARASLGLRYGRRLSLFSKQVLARMLSPINGFLHEVSDVVFLVRVLLVQNDKGAASAAQVIETRLNTSAKPRMALVLRLAAFICLSLALPRVALAEPVEVTTPIEMFDPDAGDGVRISPSLILYPQATADLTYDNNIYNFDINEVEDVVASFRPTLVLETDRARHGLRAEVGGEIRRYFDTSAENSEQFRATVNTLLELGYSIDVETTAGYRRGIERRGTAGDAFFSDAPVVFHDKTAGIEISREGNQLALSASAAVLKRDYNDTSVSGVPIDLSFRDVQVRTARLRADFSASERTSIFAETGVNAIDYEVPIFPERDSSGYDILLGVTHEVTALVEIEAGVGFIRQNFEQAGIDAAEGVNFRLAASWTPRPVWRFTASATRDVDPSQVQESPAIIASEFRLKAERAVGDRVLLEAEVGYREEDFRSSPRQDELFFVSASATYRLTDNVGVFASAGYRDQNGGDFGRTYDGVATTIGIRAAW